MSRIIGATLLLIVLFNIFCDCTAYSDEVFVSKMDLIKCRCRRLANGKKKCPSPLMPTDDKLRKDLIKCLCKRKQRKYQKLGKLCSQPPPLPPPLSLM